MASSDSRAILRANKRPRAGESSSLLSREKYSFKGKHLVSQTKHVVLNVMEYFEREAKKSKGHPNILEKVCKATGKKSFSVVFRVLWPNNGFIDG